MVTLLLWLSIGSHTGISFGPVYDGVDGFLAIVGGNDLKSMVLRETEVSTPSTKMCNPMDNKSPNKQDLVGSSLLAIAS